MTAQTSTPEVQPHPVAPALPANLNSALHAFQGENIIITKDTDGQEGNRRYKYASQAGIMHEIQPALTRYGLAVTQVTSIKQGLCTVHTQVRHISGETLDADSMEWQASDIKEAGALITYMRRYSLCAALNITTADAEDIDGTDLKQRRADGPAKQAAAAPIVLRPSSAMAQSVPQSTAAESQPPFAMEKGQDNFKRMLEAMAALKPIVGEKHYYATLKSQAGVQHANQLRLGTKQGRESAVRTWRYLDACARIVNMQERIGGQEYNRIIGSAGYCSAQEIVTLPEMGEVLREMKAAEMQQQRRGAR